MSELQPTSQTTSDSGGPTFQPKFSIAILCVTVCAIVLSQQVVRRIQDGQPRTAICAQIRGPKSLATEKSEIRSDLPQRQEAVVETNKKPDKYAWKNLFDGKALKEWKAISFGREGKVSVTNGEITMSAGDPMTGIRWTGNIPRVDYEFIVDAKYTTGRDFFCTATFPIEESYCSLVVGGWDGTVVGLSCVDFYDASDNVTTKYTGFEKNKWYKVRLRVTKGRIQAWIDGEEIVNLVTQGHEFDTRFEVDPCKPFGICTYSTTGVIRNLKLRNLKPAEIVAAAK